METKNGWFAARPSGTEDIYKIYAESFLSKDHLNKIIDEAQTIVNASHCVGFTFPGMIDEPGSFSGINISPIPERGPEANILISFAILFNETANCFKAP